MGAGTWESHHAITKLMYRYAECVDSADFEALSELFTQATIRSSAAADPKATMTGPQVGRFYAATNRVHPDGTLRTRHLSSNIIIDIEESKDSASARSYYVVFQATPKLPFQPIAGGRYEDQFIRSGELWRFADRLIHVDQIGDMSEHLSFDLAAGDVKYDELTGPNR